MAAKVSDTDIGVQECAIVVSVSFWFLTFYGSFMQYFYLFIYFLKQF